MVLAAPCLAGPRRPWAVAWATAVPENPGSQEQPDVIAHGIRGPKAKHGARREPFLGEHAYMLRVAIPYGDDNIVPRVSPHAIGVLAEMCRKWFSPRATLLIRRLPGRPPTPLRTRVLRNSRMSSPMAFAGQKPSTARGENHFSARLYAACGDTLWHDNIVP